MRKKKRVQIQVLIEYFISIYLLISQQGRLTLLTIQLKKIKFTKSCIRTSYIQKFFFCAPKIYLILFGDPLSMAPHRKFFGLFTQLPDIKFRSFKI